MQRNVYVEGTLHWVLDDRQWDKMAAKNEHKALILAITMLDAADAWHTIEGLGRRSGVDALGGITYCSYNLKLGWYKNIEPILT